MQCLQSPLSQLPQSHALACIFALVLCVAAYTVRSALIGEISRFSRPRRCSFRFTCVTSDPSHTAARHVSEAAATARLRMAAPVGHAPAPPPAAHNNYKIHQAAPCPMQPSDFSSIGRPSLCRTRQRPYRSFGACSPLMPSAPSSSPARCSQRLADGARGHPSHAPNNGRADPTSTPPCPPPPCGQWREGGLERASLVVRGDSQKSKSARNAS